MPENLSHSPGITYLLVMSSFGLFLLVMFTAYPPRVQETFLWRKPLMGSIFGLICVFGILAVFFPARCSRVFSLGKQANRPYPGKLASHGASSTLQGHHPDCENFAAHVVRIGDKTFCAACTGLLLGGLLSLVGSLSYFFSSWRVGQNSSSMVWVGIIGVGFGFFQFGFRSFVRLFLNISFVLGTSFILIGIDALIHSVAVDVFVVALILFWLVTRISLSQWDHQRICYACNIASCEFANKKRKVD